VSVPRFYLFAGHKNIVKCDVLSAAQQHAVHVHGHELTAMDVTAVAAADNAGGPVTSTSHDEGPTSSFPASSACVGGLSSKRPRSVEVFRGHYRPLVFDVCP